MSSLHLIVITDTGVINGGLAYVAVESALGMADRVGWLTFISGTDEVDVRLEAHPRIEVVKLGRTAFLDRPDRLAAAAEGVRDRSVQQRLEAILRELEPQGPALIHLHGWVKVLSPSAIAAIEASGLPWVFTAHDYFPACPNGAFYQYPAQQVCHLKPLGVSCLATHCDSRSYPHKVWRAARSAYQNAILKRAGQLRAILYPSRFTQEKLQPLLPDAKPWVVDSPMSVQRFPLAPWSPEGPITFVGRISPEKGCHLLAEAGRRLGRVVTFIGTGPALEGLKQQYPEHDYRGWQPQSFVWEFLRTAGCLAFSSVWYETAGLTALEAMALGCPVVVPTDIATTEFVEHGVTGLHFERGEVTALIAAIERALEEGEALRQAAYEHYWQYPLSVESHCTQLMEIYAGVTADA
ncbi:MAG: group 1 glycosyl transferase [Puniceicoccaceae bacterium 5H]|nr:MAG: group 1 glycosyl transferase [Puniceicoccaceae bacterium 5H]